MKDVELSTEEQIYYNIAFPIGDICRAIEDEELRIRVWDANIKYLENLMGILLN